MKKSVFLSTLVATSVVAGAAFAGTLDDIEYCLGAVGGGGGGSVKEGEVWYSPMLF